MTVRGGIDILLATHNGARTLPLMLAALRRLEAPRRPWRILAVDNASTDATAGLLAEAAGELPITPLFCAKPGKMIALKSAAAHIDGDLVVFTDDDVEPAPAWLAALEAAADAAPEAGVFGGPIRPKPIDQVSPWYAAARDHHAELFALTDHADGPVDATACIFGPNFMMRRAQLDVLGEVADELGPTFAAKRRYPMGQDTMIMNLLVRRGVTARFVRAAAVSHLVRGAQTELAFMLDRAERHGRGAAIRYVEAKRRSLARRLRVAAENAPRCLTPRPNGAEPTTEAFNALWRARWSIGAVKGALLGPYG